MIPYIRSLGFTQMLANGAEGYRANGTYDPSGPTAYPFNDWINNGQKGARTNELMTQHCTVRARVSCSAICADSVPEVIYFTRLVARLKLMVGISAGEDFVRNLGIPGIDFYGIHVVSLSCPTDGIISSVLAYY